MKNLFYALAFAIILLSATTTLARARPGQAPTKAIISGPGIEGEVQITKKETLSALKLDAAEDFADSWIPAPKVGGRYTIRRWFDDPFEFGRLTYYPMPNDTRGYVFFEDGRQMAGNTPYHNKWFYATPAGDAAMKKLLARLQVAVTDANIKPDVAVDPIPVTNNAEANTPTTMPVSKTSDDIFANVHLAVEIIIALGAGIGVWFILQQRTCAVR